jgi:hypothetical protein
MMSISPSAGGSFINRMRLRLEAWGYRWLEVPVLCEASVFAACTAGTENRMFTMGRLALLPEVTNFVRSAGEKRIGAGKVYYVMFELLAVVDKALRDRPQAARVIFFDANRVAEPYCYVALRRTQNTGPKTS